jgi:hypothetical protein
MEATERQKHREEIMRAIVKRRGKPHNGNVRDYAQEYYETLALEAYPGDEQSSVAARGLLASLMMDTFDDDFIANYVLFGKWLRQS